MTHNILIADDSKTIQRILENIVKQILPLSVIHIANNGAEALSIFKKNKISLVLTDWNMPVMNGLELVKSIRIEDKKTPIWMITTEGGRSEVVTALKEGVNNYIVKPVERDIVIDKIARLFNIKEKDDK